MRSNFGGQLGSEKVLETEKYAKNFVRSIIFINLRLRITPSQQACVESSYVRYQPFVSPQHPNTDERYGFALFGSPPGGPQHESG